MNSKVLTGKRRREFLEECVTQKVVFKENVSK